MTRKVLIALVLAFGCVIAFAQSPPVITLQPESQSVVPGTNVTLKMAAVGDAPLTYHWQHAGTNLPNNIIVTVAGGTAATSLSGPYGLAVDTSGNLFVAEIGKSRIRRLDMNGIMTTVAGGGTNYPGDGLAATNARLKSPVSVVVGTDGSLFFVDSTDNRLRKVDTNGVITTVAGNGSAGFAGDGGRATNAVLSSPNGVVIDGEGSLLIADNSRIRKVDLNGIISTVVGGGNQYPGNGGASTNASLQAVSGLAVDRFGNLYIADSLRNLVRKVSANGIITTLAGNSTAGFSGDGGAATNASLRSPTGLVSDALGNVFVADRSNRRVRIIDGKGLITTVAGSGVMSFSGDGGVAIEAAFVSPVGLALDGFGNLFIADYDGGRVRKVVASGFPTYDLKKVSIETIGDYQVVVSNSFGSVTSTVFSVNVDLFPPKILTQPKNLSVGVGGSVTYTVGAIGTLPLSYAWYFNGTNLVQSGTNSSLTLSNLNQVVRDNYLVVVTNQYGSVTSRVVTLAVDYPPTITTDPVGLSAVLGSNVVLNVTPSGAGPLKYQWQFNGTNLPNNLIFTVAGNGQAGFSGDGGLAVNAQLNFPWGVAVDALGNVLIADHYNDRIRKVATDGIITTVAGSGAHGFSGDGGPATNAAMHWPNSVAVDSVGNIYIGDGYESNGSHVRKVGVDGIVSTVAGNGSRTYQGDGIAATNTGLTGATLGAVDSVGNIFFLDENRGRVHKVDTKGIITTLAGGGRAGDGGAATNASLNRPFGLAVDEQGVLFVSDFAGGGVRKVDAYGIISTIAGGGSGSSLGDGGPATNAYVSPLGLANDSTGNLFIADAGNHRIRKVDVDGIITTVAGGGSRITGYIEVATNSTFQSCNGVALDTAGNLYVTDGTDHRLRKVALAGLPRLMLNNLAATNIGNYQVIVTSPYGSVTSRVATVTVVNPTNQLAVISMRTPVIAGSNLVLGFSLSQGAGSAFTLLQATNVTGPWTTNLNAVLTTNAAGGGFRFTVPVPDPAGFYQVRSP